jgi:undecaprenyl-diphosphatase
VTGSGLALLAVSWLLLGDRGTVPGWEVDVFDALNALPDVLRWPLWPIMLLGTLPMYVVGGAGVYALTKRARPALATASAVLLAWIVARIVKDAVERGRPVDLLDDVTLRQSNPDGYGYVSGHTSVAFALATALTVVLPGRWRWVPLPMAALVGFARVFYGVHLPLDVVGGVGVGLVCGTVAVVALGADTTPPPDAVAAPEQEPADPAAGG